MHRIRRLDEFVYLRVKILTVMRVEPMNEKKLYGTVFDVIFIKTIPATPLYDAHHGGFFYAH